MGIFDRKTKEEKQVARQERLDAIKDKRMAKFIKKFNLDELDERDYKSVSNIAADMIGNGAFEVSQALDFKASASEKLTASRLSILNEQNWIIINQNSRINSNLERLIELLGEKK